MLVKPVVNANDPPGAALHPDQLFRREFRYVWTTLKRLGVFERDLEDVTHEVFIRVADQLPLYDPTRPLRPWLFGIALGIASNYRRLRRHRTDLAGKIPDTADPATGAEELLGVMEERALVHAALQKVPLEQRAVLVLHEIDGFVVPEVAAALGISVNTAYSRLRLGRDAFRNHARRMMISGERR